MTDALTRTRRALGDRRRDPIPFVLGAAAISTGLMLRAWRPAPLDLPAARRAPRLPDPRDGRDAARQAREAVATVTPDNAAAGVGRSLIFMGAGLIAVALFDALEDRDAG